MQTYKLKGILDESLLNMTILKRFKGKEVEIIVKKTKPLNNSRKNLVKAQDIMRKYIPENSNLSGDLISDRRKEFELE